MDWFSFIFAGILVYVSVLVFIGGLIYRVIEWHRVVKTPVKLGMFPKPASSAGRVVKLAKDMFLFPQVLDMDVGIWLVAGAFHLAGLLMFIGHLRLIHEFTPLAG